MPHDTDAQLRNGTRTLDPPPRPQRNEIVVYQPDETLRLDVRLENETVWLTQEQIANLFGTQRPAITKHLANIYKSGELDREDTCSILEHMGNDGKQTYRIVFYNLDAILSVGYRVNSRNATLFRRWATQVLKSYLLKGYAINARLNQLEDKVDRRLVAHDKDIAELKEKVDFFVRTQTPPLQGVFYDGQLWDARAFADRLVKSARKSLLLVDNFSRMPPRDFVAGGIRRFSASLGPSLLRKRGHLFPLFRQLVVSSSSSSGRCAHAPRLFQSGPRRRLAAAREAGFPASALLSRTSVESASRSRSWMRTKSAASRKPRSRRRPASDQAAVDATGQTPPATAIPIQPAPPQKSSTNLLHKCC